MKRLMIGLVLAVFLVGCGEKSEFSINENDTSEAYANNSVFTKVEGYGPFEAGTVYKFTSAPASIYGDIKTSDLNVLGGYIIFSSKASRQVVTSLTIKGKANADKLMDRSNQSEYLKDMNCEKLGMEKGHQVSLSCSNFKTNKRTFNIIYNPFTDSATLHITRF